MKKIIILLCITSFNLLYAQTIAYKCIDTQDSKYWQYFNIDHNSLHFKVGKVTVTLYHKKTRYKEEKSIHTFSNGSLTFYVTQITYDFTKLYVTDNQYSYNCHLEQMFSGPTSEHSVINE